MIKYISDFLAKGQNDDTFLGARVSYFSPFWKFWDKRIQRETSECGRWVREYDQTGRMIRIMRQQEMLHPCGVGQKFYWEVLDLKTLTAVSHALDGVEKRIYSNGRCQRIQSFSDGCQRISYGYMTQTEDIKFYAHLICKNGKNIEFIWARRVENADIWKKILRENTPNYEEKEAVLNQVTERCRKNAAPVLKETALHEINNETERARLMEHRHYVLGILDQVRFEKKAQGMLSYWRGRERF
ncbi:MAG: hypothetical protein SPL08_00595 [Pseudomonadota bacterium]|nr:hypothetical protein [Pseudomonadota bacterium]